MQQVRLFRVNGARMYDGDKTNSRQGACPYDTSIKRAAKGELRRPGVTLEVAAKRRQLDGEPGQLT